MTFDIIIVGAGPAGLSAALYASRFRRSTLVIHDGRPRAAYIPLTHNVPGYDSGIAGCELLERMTRHAQNCGATFVQERVTDISLANGLFHVVDGNGVLRSGRAVILATGLDQNEPPLDEDVHQAAINAGVLRYCPVCDGFEHQGERIGVLGCDTSGAAEALFLRGYSDDVTLLPRRDVELSAEEQRELEQAGIHIVSEAVSRFEPTDRHMLLHLEGRSKPLAFNVLYPALGSRPRNRLAHQLGLKTNAAGKVAATSPFVTDMPGLYCVGDLVEGLDQISVAMGHGAVAATKVHNWLRECDGQTPHAVLGHD
ncbi:NAD(P)/FAD-dependent oxidoreductase [Erythrobacter sp. NFXS35]|uniref:NAD(P)/FAD-dependent oxidoreductase n=1 Tax=Erythrobacter sp. NFXS35 TaxID=2818436 RepID=UPI0032DF9D6B